MKHKTIFTLLALMAIGIIASSGIVSAYRGDYSIEGPDYNEERHELIKEAFDSLDYSAWKQLMTEKGRNPRIIDVVNEGNFETFVQAHEAGKNKDYETASRLRAELGLNNGNGPKDGTGRRLHQNKIAGLGKRRN